MGLQSRTVQSRLQCRWELTRSIAELDSGGTDLAIVCSDGRVHTYQVFYATKLCINSAHCKMNTFYFTGAEFLKLVIMQSQNYAKFLRICAKVGLRNAKQEKSA